MPPPVLTQNITVLQLIVDAVPIPLFVKDRQHRWVVVNTACSTLLGMPKEELRLKSDFDLFPEEQARQSWSVDEQILASGEGRCVEESLTDKRGRTRWILSNRTCVQVGSELMVFGSLNDISALREGEARSRHLALHDALTGLPNRMLFVDRLEHLLARLQRKPAACALLCLEIVRFKEVNDILGRHAGDKLLCEFGYRMTRLVRPSDTVARFDGEQFVILLSDLTADFDIGRFCRRLLDSTAAPFLIARRSLSVEVAIGVAQFSDAGADSVELLRRADIALYHAKHEGQDYSVFSTGLDEGLRQQAMLRTELRQALAGAVEGLELCYQPYAGNAGFEVVGVEALAQWRHPRLGLLPPAQLLALATQIGMDAELEEWVRGMAFDSAFQKLL